MDLVATIWAAIDRAASDAGIRELIELDEADSTSSGLAQVFRKLDRLGADRALLRQLLMEWAAFALAIMGSILDGTDSEALDGDSHDPKWGVFTLDRMGNPELALESLGTSLTIWPHGTSDEPLWNNEILP